MFGWLGCSLCIVSTTIFNAGRETGTWYRRANLRRPCTRRTDCKFRQCWRAFDGSRALRLACEDSEAVPSSGPVTEDMRLAPSLAVCVMRRYANGDAQAAVIALRRTQKLTVTVYSLARLLLR